MTAVLVRLPCRNGCEAQGNPSLLRITGACAAGHPRVSWECPNCGEMQRNEPSALALQFLLANGMPAPITADEVRQWNADLADLPGTNEHNCGGSIAAALACALASAAIVAGIALSVIRHFH